MPQETLEQVLRESRDRVYPQRAMTEIWRVLRKGGIIFLSAPAVFVQDNEKEYRRFLPEGLRYLLRDFEGVEVIPEGNSLTNLFRTINVFLTSFMKPKFLAPILAWTVVPVLNIAGFIFGKLARNNDSFTSNFSVWARK